MNELAKSFYKAKRVIIDESVKEIELIPEPPRLVPVNVRSKKGREHKRHLLITEKGKVSLV